MATDQASETNFEKVYFRNLVLYHINPSWNFSPYKCRTNFEGSTIPARKHVLPKRISTNPSPNPLALTLNHNNVFGLTKWRHFSRKATFTDLRNLMQNFSTFSLACLFYFTFGPKSFVHLWTVKWSKQTSEKVDKLGHQISQIGKRS